MAEEHYILCPYCGHVQRESDRCDECRGLFEPLSRRATQISMGPWYIRDAARPFRPGCSFEVLKRQAQAGRIKPTSVIRGPTTRQFWALAKNVPGLAHLLGYCHQCGAEVQPGMLKCRQCDAVFSEPSQRNELGLLYPTYEAAEAAQRELDRRLALMAQAPTGDSEGAALAAPPEPEEALTPEPSTFDSRSTDLLDQVLGATARTMTPPPPPPPPPVAPPPQPALPILPVTPPPAPVAAVPVSPLPPPSASPEALDFSPSEEDAPAAPATPPTRVNLVTWLLVASNATVMLLCVLLIVSFGRSKADEDTTDRDLGWPAYPNPSAGTTGSTTSPGPAASAPDAMETARAALRDALVQAQRLEREGKVGEALALLQNHANTTVLRPVPVDLDSEINRLRNKMTLQRLGGGR